MGKVHAYLYISVVHKDAEPTRSTNQSGSASILLDEMGIADPLINAGKVREVAWPECRVAKLEAWLWLGCAEEASAA